MRCPRCQQENPPGRGFCIKCAYPLPEEPHQPQQEPQQAPVMEPIRFDTPINNPYAAPYAMPKRRIGLGVASLILGILGLFDFYYTLIFATAGPQLVQQYLDAGILPEAASIFPDATYLAATCAVFYGFFGLVLGALGTIFGGIALSRFQKNPQLYRGKGTYIAGLILSIVVLIGSAVGFFMGITMI